MLVDAADRPRLPAPVRHQRRPRPRLPEPDHRGGVRPAPSDDGDRSVNGASWVGRAGVEKEYDAWLRGIPGYRSVEVDSMGRVLDDDGDAEEPAGRHPGHLDRRPGAERRREAARGDDPDRPGDPRPGHRHRNYVADSGAAVVMEADTGRIVAMASQPTYDPVGLGRRDLPEAAVPALLQQGGDPAARPGHAGPVRTRLDLEAVHDRGRAHQRLRVRHPAELLLGVPGRQPGLQELRVRRLRLHRLRPGARGLVQHLLLPRRLRLLAAVRLRRRRRRRPRPAGRGGPGVRLRQRDRHRHAGRGLRPDRRPQVEARLLRVAEGLLLRPRRQAAGHARPATSSTSSPRSSASRATPTAPATR